MCFNNNNKKNIYDDRLRDMLVEKKKTHTHTDTKINKLVRERERAREWCELNLTDGCVRSRTRRRRHVSHTNQLYYRLCCCYCMFYSNRSIEGDTLNKIKTRRWWLLLKIKYFKSISWLNSFFFKFYFDCLQWRFCVYFLPWGLYSLCAHQWTILLLLLLLFLLN